jgi:diguanylate cyclase (GGDEF)-like protein
MRTSGCSTSILMASSRLINDTYGHAAGDEVLQAVARRLDLATRPGDTTARLGGDEFAVVAPRISPEGLAGLVARLTIALTEPHLIHGNFLTVGASIGTYLATAGENAAASVHQADTSMYAAKSSRQPRA